MRNVLTFHHHVDTIKIFKQFIIIRMRSLDFKPTIGKMSLSFIMAVCVAQKMMFKS